MKKIKVKQEYDEPIEVDMNIDRQYTIDDQLREEANIKDEEGNSLI